MAKIDRSGWLEEMRRQREAAASKRDTAPGKRDKTRNAGIKRDGGARKRDSVCGACGATLEQSDRPGGRRREYCNATCRKRASRARAES